MEIKLSWPFWPMCRDLKIVFKNKSGFIVNNSSGRGLYKSNGMTYYEYIHGVIQHDAYHLGQIVLLAKSL
jgi:hypothetical protein